MKIQSRKGFTLVELLIVAVLGAVVLMAAFEVLRTNTRAFTNQTVQIQSQQTLRGGMDILFSELREVSPPEGDLLEMDPTSLRIRASRSFAMVCSIISFGSTPVVRVRRVGQRLLGGDSVAVFKDNDPKVAGDDWWDYGEIGADVDVGVDCPDGALADQITLNGVTIDAPPDSVLTGAPVRTYRVYGYSLATWEGESYLMRTDPDEGSAPMVGPLDQEEGLRFTYLDENGATTAVPTAVAQIQVELMTRSEARTSGGVPMSDTLRARVNTRN